MLGNTDEMLFRPDSLTDFASQSPQMQSLLTPIQEMGNATCEMLGSQRIGWLSSLPLVQVHDAMGLVHASPQSLWRAPMPEASEPELRAVYSPLGRPVAVYAHIHWSVIRSLPELIVVNTGSVSLSHDGDRRAAYLVLDDSGPTIRRLEYDVGSELKALSTCGMPHADWTARMLSSARPQLP